MNNEYMSILSKLRKNSGKATTIGISDAKIAEFLSHDNDLGDAILRAENAFEHLNRENPNLFQMEEESLIKYLQEDYINFYARETRSPYVPIAAKGPWIITFYGAVIHDSGGYGMLGLGHGKEELISILSEPKVMANIMTGQFSQKKFSRKLKEEIGQTRGSCPYKKFICMNSGSESISVASRIIDINTRKITAKGRKHEGKKVMQLSLKGSFHGRTYRAATVSDSTMGIYQKHLASLKDYCNLVTIEANNISELERAFSNAKKEQIFFEAFYIEPVMGEGVPGLALTPEFYNRARALTKENGTVLVVDSIQAALRAQGYLSIVDYPGFENCEAPDIETYSKALNAGQYPLSVLALSEDYSDTYIPGTYGNTMTTNPMALEIGYKVLDLLNDDIRDNIRQRGTELKQKLTKLSHEFPGTISHVTGTGLIVNAELNEDRYQVVGDEGFECFLRKNGIHMIHGGKNGIRFTPHFSITSQQIDLIVDTVKKGLQM